MKTYKLTVLLIVVLFFIASCSKPNNADNSLPPPLPDTLSSGWTKHDVDPGGVQLFDVFFADASKGYCISGNNIYRTADGGTNWTKIFTASNLTNIAAYGNNACFVNHSNTIYYTSDGGATVQMQQYFNSPPSNKPAFTDVFYTKTGTCFASSEYNFYKSTNGGASFDSISTFINHSSSLNNLSFSSETVGWMAREEGIYQTNNGGLSWLRNTNAVAKEPILVSFFSASVGYYSTKGKLYRTGDGGNSWQLVFNLGADYYVDFDIIDDQTVYLCAGNRVYKTVNGGTQWNVVAALGQSVIFEIHFINANKGWACSSNGTILRFN